MAELRKCSRCRSEIELGYFSINRKGQYNKTCDGCLAKVRTHQQTQEAKQKRLDWNVTMTTCKNCGDCVQKNTLSIHRRRFWCQTHNMIPKPDFEEWLQNQEYDKLLWEYKKLLDEIIERKRKAKERWNECLIDSDDDEETKDTKSKLALQLLGPIEMF